MEYLTIEYNTWSAQVCPELGGNILCLTHEGRDILYPKLSHNPYLTGAPILLPANRTAGGRFTFQGKDYTLPVNEPRTGCHLHGLLHRQVFSLVKHTKNSICLSYENKGRIYPFPFLFTVTYSLSEQGLRSDYRIENTGTGDMPLVFALHTTFVRPDYLQIPLELLQEKTDLHIPTGRYLPLNETEQNLKKGCPGKGVSVSGYYTSAGDTATIGSYRYQAPGFDHWVLYTDGTDSEFVCVEPQLGKVNALNDPASCPRIPAGEDLLLTTYVFCG